MRLTLRRSCDACVKAKSRCDLQTPTCSRCVKRKVNCVFQNEPLTAHATTPKETFSLTRTSSPATTQRSSLDAETRLVVGGGTSLFPMSIGAGFPDPFDSYPQTSLPRIRVQGLIHHFLSKIAFQYYPLDLDPKSNPFVASWWPLALTDPALFNVSLQTASLDDELRAEKGFANSDTLMADSVALVRQKIQNPSLAFQDATMDAVVTMAAIEFGKGKLEVSKMHISGILRMVEVRGGLQEVKRTSPLTARMVPWVAMLVLGTPQFPTQDDFGFGDGVSTIPLWKNALFSTNQEYNHLDVQYLALNSSLQNVLSRLRNIFSRFSDTNPQKLPEISTTDLHDLTCFILHRLLPIGTPLDTPSTTDGTSNCMRSAISIYMLIVHGPTYYSHACLLGSLVLQLKNHLEFSPGVYNADNSFKVWLLSLGMVASKETTSGGWFTNQAMILAPALELCSWKEILVHLKRILWLDTERAGIFRQVWEEVFHSTSLSEGRGSI